MVLVPEGGRGGATPGRPFRCSRLYTAKVSASKSFLFSNAIFLFLKCNISFYIRNISALHSCKFIHKHSGTDGLMYGQTTLYMKLLLEENLILHENVHSQI